jgi:hypothetical protein
MDSLESSSLEDLKQDLEKLCNQSVVCIYGYKYPLNYVSTFRFNSDTANWIIRDYKNSKIVAFVGYESPKDCIDECIGFKHLYIGIKVCNNFQIPNFLTDDSFLNVLKKNLDDTPVGYQADKYEDFQLGYHTFLSEV